MNTQEILQKINQTKNDCTISMKLINKQGNQYSFFDTNLSNDIQKELKEFILPRITTIINENSLEPFNPTGKKDETIEFIKVQEVTTFSDFLDCYDDTTNFVEKISKLETINSYLIHIIGANGNDLKIFRKYSKTKSLSQGLRYKLTDHTFDRLKDQIFIIDETIDFIVINDEDIIVMNRYAFEIITNYRDNYTETLNTALDLIQQSELIDNFEQFKEDCCNSMRIAKQFTRAMKQNSIAIINDNPDLVSQAIVEAELPIAFINNKFQYESREQLSILVALLSDEYAKTLITKKIHQI